MAQHGKEQILRGVEAFGNRHILVVGDLFLDEYVETTMCEISREGPMPVLRFDSMRQVAGAAGNLAASLRGLGAAVSLAAVIGDDERGRVLLDQLESKRIGHDAVLVDPAHPTLTYTKIRSRVENSPSQELFRIDVLPRGPLDEKLEAKVLERVEIVLEEVDGVIVLDQAAQLATGRILREVPQRARQRGRFVQGSSRERIGEFRGFDLITPNDREASEALGLTAAQRGSQTVEEIGSALRSRGGHRAVLMTLGADGMVVFPPDDSGVVHVPSDAREVVDVTGAGDSVSAVALLGSVSGWSLATAARVASLAASIVIARVGTHHLSAEELVTAVERADLPS